MMPSQQGIEGGIVSIGRRGAKSMDCRCINAKRTKLVRLMENGQMKSFAFSKKIT